MATVLEETISQRAEPQIGLPGFPTDLTGDGLPEAFAPLVRNAWYVVAECKDLGRDLRHITALSEPLVMYRTEAGEAVVLDDRCAHRRFRLSKGKLVGDAVQCGYHGFTYDKTGACIWAPTLRTKPKFGVRRYPSAERGPWVWAWFGDPTKADPADVPFPKLDPNSTWTSAEGYKLNPGNYMFLIENLMDLTHLHFLHGPDVATREQADNPPKSVDLGPDAVAWHKETVDVCSGLFASMAGCDPQQLVTVQEDSYQVGPAINVGITKRVSRQGEENGLYPVAAVFVHGLTPQDINATHQFFQVSLTFEPKEGIEAFRDLLEGVVFQQDVDVITEMNQMVLADDRTGTVEYGIPGDRYGIKMRKILRRMKGEEVLNS